MVVRRPWLRGLSPVGGSFALVGMRWLLFLVAGLPSLAMAVSSVEKHVARHAYFAEAPDPLPMVPLLRMLGSLPAPVWTMLLVAAIFAWFGNLLLMAGAVTVFSRSDGKSARRLSAPLTGARISPSISTSPRVWRSVVDSGTRSLWVYLRIALVSVLLAALGVRCLGWLTEQVLDQARTSLWTLHAQFLVQTCRALATLGWLTLVGVFAWWCRVIAVADGRRRMRRIWITVLRLWWRKPIASLAAHFLLALATFSSGSWSLVAWRQSPAGFLGWTCLWLTLLAVAAFVWHWRLRAGCLLWSTGELADLRAVPDEPWHLPSRIASRLRWFVSRGSLSMATAASESDLDREDPSKSSE